MSEKRKLYQLNWIWIAIVAWELVFWSAFILVHNALGWWSEENLTGGNLLRYQHPKMLYGFFLLLPLIVIFVSNIAWRNKVLKNNFASHLIPLQFKSFSTLNTFIKFFFFRNGFAFLILALANPQFGTKKVEGKAKSMEIIVALDISSSMKVLDMSQKQSRLESTKRGLIQLINQLHGDRIGIVVFAGEAYPQLALTSDYAAAKLFVDEISTDMITNQGTNIPAAIDLAIRSFSKAKTTKVTLLLTDGENHMGNLKASIQRAKEKGIVVNAVGIGTEKGGPIPMRNGGCMKNNFGKIVISKMNPNLVRKIAQLGGGNFAIEHSAFPNFKPLLNNVENLDKGMVKVDDFKVSEQQGIFFLWLSVLCFTISVLWSISVWGFLDKITKVK